MRIEIDQALCPGYDDCQNSLEDDAIAWCIHECSDCDRALLVCVFCSEGPESGAFTCETCLDPEGAVA